MSPFSVSAVQPGQNYQEHILRAVKPRFVIAGHWEDFFRLAGRSDSRRAASQLGRIHAPGRAVSPGGESKSPRGTGAHLSDRQPGLESGDRQFNTTQQAVS